MADACGMTPIVDEPLSVIYVDIVKHRFAAVQKIPDVSERLETNDVSAAHVFMDSSAHEFRQDAPVVWTGPGDVSEVENRRARHFLSNHCGCQVEVVVLKQHVWRLCLLLRFINNRLGDRFVDRYVPGFPSFVYGAADVRRARRVPHEVLDEPEQGVAEDI